MFYMRLLVTPVLCLVSIFMIISCTDRESNNDHVHEPTVESTGSTASRIPIPDSEPMIRVRLQRVAGDLVPIRFSRDGELVLVRDNDGNQIDVKGPITVRRDHQGWLIRDRDSTRIPKGMIDAVWLDLSTDGNIRIKDDSGETREYSGTIRCIHISDSNVPTWEVVEHVGMERYLPGVLAGELYRHWGLQCQAAQAIAARSFACMQIAFRQRKNWDVIDTAGSQAYIGIVTDDRLDKACSMTKGMVLTWGAEIVPGYFSSCCGGLAATATEGIGPNPINSLKPLLGHTGTGYCQEAPLYSWSRECDPDELAAAIRASAIHGTSASRIRSISKIEIIKKNKHGRGIGLSITDISGNNIEMAASKLATISSRLADGRFYSGWLEGYVVGGRLKLSGHGYGHGVGLCQYGSAAMDRQGKSFWQMIEYYYPQAEIKKAW